MHGYDCIHIKLIDRYRWGTYYWVDYLFTVLYLTLNQYFSCINILLAVHWHIFDILRWFDVTVKYIFQPLSGVYNEGSISASWFMICCAATWLYAHRFCIISLHERNLNAYPYRPAKYGHTNKRYVSLTCFISCRLVLYRGIPQISNIWHGCTLPCSLHLLHYINSVKGETNSEI